MSEVVKKLVTELGFKLVDQAALKKYSNTSKDILKTQKETDKAQKETNKATEKGLSLKQKEKEALKQETTLKKQALIEEGKLKSKAINEETKLRLEQIRGVSSTKRKALTDEQKKEKEIYKQNEKDRLQYNKELSKKHTKQSEKYEKERQKYKENLDKQIQNRAIARQYVINTLNGEHNRILKERATIEKSNLKTSLDNDIAKAQARQKEYQAQKDLIAQQKQSFFSGIHRQQQQVYDSKGGIVSQRKVISPTPTPTPSKQSIFTFPTQSEKQSAREDIATNIGQRTVDVSWNIIKDSADTFLNFSNKMKELEVFGGLSKSELDIMKAQILSSSVKYGYKPTDVAEIGVGYSLAGVKGKSLTNITEVTTGTARAGRTTPQKAEEVLNSIAHQFGVDFEKFGEVAKMSDAIITVMNESKLGFEDVNTAMKYFGPMAQQMGMSLEDTLTLVGLWSQRGIKGSTPGTSGRQALIKTAQELAGMWETGTGGEGSKGKLFRKKKGKMDKSTSLAELGVTKESVLDKKGKFNFFKLIEQLRSSFKKKGLNEYQKIGALTDIFGVIPSSALASLMKDYSKTDLSLIQHMANTGGAREKTATGLMGSQQMQVGQTQAKIDISKINLGATFSKDIDTLNLSISRLAETYNKSPALQSLSGDLLRIAGVGGALVGAAGGIRLLGLALGLPVFAVGAPWILGITAISLGFNDIWNALNGRESYLLNVGNWFHKLGGSILNFLDTSIIPAIKYMDSLFQSVRNFLGLESNKTFNVDVVVKGGQQFGFSGGLPSSPKPTGSGINWNKTMNKSTATRAG